MKCNPQVNLFNINSNQIIHAPPESAGFLLGFFQGGAAKNFLGGAPSKFSGANDSRGGGQNFFKENEIFT